MFKEKKEESEPWTTVQDRYKNGKIINPTSRNLCRKNPNFTSGKLVEACGLHRGQVSNRTVRRVLNKHGFGYRQARKKGFFPRMILYVDISLVKRFAKINGEMCGLPK